LPAWRASRWTGKANGFSPDRVDWAEIAAVEDATVKPSTAPLPLRDSAAIGIPGAGPTRDVPRVAAIIRQRRSAIAMDARTGLSREAFFGILARTLPDRPTRRGRLIDFPARILLWPVRAPDREFSPGLYVLVRDEARLDAFPCAATIGSPGGTSSRAVCVYTPWPSGTAARPHSRKLLPGDCRRRRFQPVAWWADLRHSR